MSIYRYSEWDGSQDIPGSDADELMDELGRHLMNQGDLSQAMRLLQRAGLRDSQGRRLPGIQELLQRLRQQRKSQLEKYNLGSMMEEMRQKLASVLKTEREGIQRRLDEARQKSAEGGSELSPEMREKLRKTVEDMAAQNLKKLDALPPDMGGRIKELSGYDFMDDEARRQFQELMDMLKKQAMESYGRDLVQQLKNMDAGALAGVRHMVEALNQMLEQCLRGEKPDFNGFMEQFGNFFGPQPPESLDELMERLQSQIAQAQSLLKSLSPEDRRALEDILDSMLDEATRYEMAKLAANLETLHPGDNLRKRYPFTGEESISYSEALRLMETLQQMDKLETQLSESQYQHSLDSIDEELLKKVMGDESAGELEQLRNISKVLEEAGYLRWQDGKYELTPRGMRKIGQRALEGIFAELRRDRVGGHNVRLRGAGGERIEETKPYEFGDDFHVHLQKTIMNAIFREPKTPPIKLSAEDFEVFQTEELTRSATVLMLDLSLSMPMRGNFQAAKRVAVALDGLMRTQYPRDVLHIVGFSSYARRIKTADIVYLNWDDFDPYTNMQHGLFLARKLLDKETCTNKQIILISDGEPTAHFEGENIYFQYPPSLRTLQMTLREVRNCTRKGIVINTFMLESAPFVSAFVAQMARVNKGRVFFTSADSLGQYLLVDYVSNKKRRI